MSRGSTGESPGILSMVGTPIGNLQDASPRVIDSLRQANVVFCEDTRVTSRLLSRFEVHVPLRRCDEHVIASRVAEVVRRVREGERMAFVSDAGMPCVSDPGQALVDAVLREGLPLEVIPGPSAVTCALVASGLPMAQFFFEGFLPRKPGAQLRRLSELASVPGALVFYESPKRVVGTLASIAQVMPGRRVALVRELTKVHEEVVRDVAPVLAERIAAREEIRGECVIVVEGPTGEEISAVSVPLEDAIREGLAAGEAKSALAKRLAREYGLSRSEVYDRLLALS